MADLKWVGRRTILLAILGTLLSACLFRVTLPTVKIGLVAPFEGLYRELGYDVLFAVRLALRERNGTGGAQGYRVELVALDDSGDPQQALERARELTLDPQVMGVIGHLRDETTLAAAPIYRQHGLPLIAVGAPSMLMNGDEQPVVFRLDADQKDLARSLFDHASRELGAQRIAWLGFRGDVIDDLLEASREFGAMEMRGFSTPGALNERAADDAWDAIIFSGSDQGGADLVSRLKENRSRSFFLGDQGLDTPIFVAWAGRAANGVVYASSNIRVEDPQFIAKYRSLAATDPGPRAALAYDATGLLLEAIEDSIRELGRPTPQGVLAALRRGEPYAGLTGDIRFDQNGQRLDAPVYLYRIEGGSYPGIAGGGYSHSHLTINHKATKAPMTDKHLGLMKSAA